ncbi:MAG: hypothetical protein SOR83_11765 [Butyricicoccus pullicaecorum]|nr:hypothetical protein [Butyricicoccus pullicaecorum]
MKKVLISFLCCFSIFVANIPAAFAADLSTQMMAVQDVQTIDYGDGFTVTITTTLVNKNTRSTTTYSKTAVARYDGIKVGEFTLHGEFSYNGSSAKATNVGFDVEDYSGWSHNKPETKLSGAKASGKCTFYKGSTSKTVSLSMTCSPDGDIS